jgi:glycine dehydrogenase
MSDERRVVALDELGRSRSSLVGDQGQAVSSSLNLDLAPERFVDRHIGPRPSERAQMLEQLGFASSAALIDAAVPSAVRSRAALRLPAAISEETLMNELREIAEENEVWTSLIGMGFHGTVTPAVIRRNVLENPAWYTAYTPYQAEISQGRLEALLVFQTMVSELTGLPVANASLLDEASAAAEAMSMCFAANRRSKRAFFVDQLCHPQTIEVVETRASAQAIDVVVADPSNQGDFGAFFGVLLQYPATNGELRDLAPIISLAHAGGARVAVAADPLALTLLVPPGELGADIAIGTTQRFGVPMWYGGPHAAYLAAREELERLMPGRIVGVSVDAEQRPAFRLALQTREQHIRRERATSNICTAQALLAIVAGLYAVYHGPEGLRAIASRVHRLTVAVAEGLRRAGYAVITQRYFDSIAIATGSRTDALLSAAAARRVNLRRIDDETIGINLDETSTQETVELVLSIFDVKADPEGPPGTFASPINATLLRNGPCLTHPVFVRHRSETAMLRYLRRLADKDLALDRTMIPLGSCTMKLNAAAEMEPISWRGFSDLHPYAPLDQAKGTRRIVEDLERYLCELSGYDAVSLQPNAGSQGELAGLLAIRRYHESQGEEGRKVCLLPTSAHGTNAASAALAGMSVVPVACDASGNVDVGDLEEKIEAHRGALGAIMLTYPSTHGVYEEAITEICERVHDAGGQVYIDGANFNALAGIGRYAEIGGDVSHFNLHKTFCVPHGGGGPGVGPIGVRAHLAPFLPGSRALPEACAGRRGGAIAAAPYGSPGVLPIAWAYLRLMGPDGLREATEAAVVAANYIASRLSDHYPILYRGRNGLVAHECILDIRTIAATAGVTSEDIAKRLIDFGIHAPTMSFPVAGTLMVEPTESEPLVELDRFCDAMIEIREEINAIVRGEVALERSPLRLAPHTADAVTAEVWDRPYGRAQAALLARSDLKYWPPVARIDNAYGDRHLFCTCPQPEENRVR